MNDIETRLRMLTDAGEVRSIHPHPSHLRRIRRRRSLMGFGLGVGVAGLIAGAAFFVRSFSGPATYDVAGGGPSFGRLISRLSSDESTVIELDSERGTVCYDPAAIARAGDFDSGEIFGESSGVVVELFPAQASFVPRGGGARCVQNVTSESIAAVLARPRAHGVRLTTSESDVTIAPLLPMEQDSTGLAGEESNSLDAGIGGLWPANTASGIRRSCVTRDDIDHGSPEGVALDFTYFALGWDEATTKSSEAGAGGQGRLVTVEREGSGEVLVAAHELAPSCWYVSSVIGPDGFDASTVGLVEVEGREVTVEFDHGASTSVMLEMAHGDRPDGQWRWRSGEPRIEVTLSRPPRGLGHFLLLFYEGDEVVTAIGGGLPAGRVSSRTG